MAEVSVQLHRPSVRLHSVTPQNAVLNKHSSILTQKKENGGAKAMLYATGMTEEDMSKPQLGITSISYDSKLLQSGAQAVPYFANLTEASWPHGSDMVLTDFRM